MGSTDVTAPSSNSYTKRIVYTMDDDGNRDSVAVSYRYDPYGAVTITRNSTPQSTDPLGNPWMFMGRFADEESSFLYYGDGYYSSETARLLRRGSGSEHEDAEPSSYWAPNQYGDAGARWAPTPSPDENDNPPTIELPPTTGGKPPSLPPGEDEDTGGRHKQPRGTGGGSKKKCTGPCPEKKYAKVYRIRYAKKVKASGKKAGFKVLVAQCKNTLPDLIRREANDECKDRGGEKCWCDFSVSTEVAGKTSKASHGQPGFNYTQPGNKLPPGGRTYTLYVYCRVKITLGTCKG
jgi:hypothetical protein